MTPDGRSSWQTVILSPHFDDAALSVAGLIGRLDRPAAVVTVHGGPPPPGQPLSDWDGGCGFTSPEEAYERRVAEDARACALLDVEQVRLPHADGPYRESAPLTALTQFLAALPPSTEVLVPLGTNQPDHAAVRDQALQCLTEAGRMRIRLFADLPYSAVVPGWGTADVLSGFQTSSAGLAYREVHGRYGLEYPERVQLDATEWRRKRDAVLCYATQLGPVGSMAEVRDCGTLLSWPGVLQFEVAWRVQHGSRPPVGWTG